MKNKITRSAVFTAVGKSWFDLTEEDGRIELETRLHGDVGEEIAGEEDKKEGMRILRALRKAFPVAHYKTTFDVVDEWVSVSIRVEPFDKAERAVIIKEAKLVKLNVKLREVIETLNAPTRAENKNYKDPASVYVATGYSYSLDRVEVEINFGERFLYTNHLGAGIKFATTEAAEAAGRAMLLTAFPSIEWKVEVGKLYEKTTYNNPAPYNVIEKVGKVKFTALLGAFIK